MLKHLLNLVLAISFMPLAAQGQKVIDSIYQQAKAEFETFEAQHGGFIETQNGSMHYLEWGDEANTPLIWIHGSFTNAYEIKPFAKDLMAAGYRLIAIDYYGHGQTKIPDHEVSLYHVADDLKQLMDVKGIDKAIIGGSSRGGFIATAFYDAYREMVLGLILEDGGSVATNTFYHQMDSKTLEERVKGFFQERPFEAEFESRKEAFQSLYLPDDGGSQFESLAWIAQKPNGQWAICPGADALFNMANASQFLNTVLRSTNSTLFGRSMAAIEPRIIYRNLNVPMLILDPVSEDDLFPFEAENGNLKALHPQLITHRVFQDTGHNVHYERPEAFTKELIAFLKVVRN